MDVVWRDQHINPPHSLNVPTGALIAVVGADIKRAEKAAGHKNGNEVIDVRSSAC